VDSSVSGGSPGGKGLKMRDSKREWKAIWTPAKDAETGMKGKDQRECESDEG
jgi:hypothetical protein